IVDSWPAPVSLRPAAGVGDCSGAHEGAAGAGGLPTPELEGGIDDDPHALGVNAQLLHGDLDRDRVNALAHLGPAVADLEVAFLRETDHRRHHLQQTVAEAGVLEPQPEPDRLAGGHGRIVGGTGRFEACESPAGTL